VLVDDLVTQGVTEPYRMFTSRAEFRLQLREDNADLRLTEAGRRLGLVDDARWDAHCRKRDTLSREQERLKSTWVNPNTAAGEPTPSGWSARRWNTSTALIDLLRRPGVGFDAVAEASPHRGAGQRQAGFDVSRETLAVRIRRRPLAGAVIEQLEIQTKYAGYIDKQQDEVERAAAYEQMHLPEDAGLRPGHRAEP
jgi:tRNA uridine 5-carboxymethylaminomethyl modification enzyme